MIRVGFGGIQRNAMYLVCKYYPPLVTELYLSLSYKNETSLELVKLYHSSLLFFSLISL